jgi:hypothetical protein
MGKLISILGVLLVVYTVIAQLMELPQLSDYFPVGLFANTGEKFYKIVASDEPSYINYYVIGFGLLLVIVGLLINKIKARND